MKCTDNWLGILRAVKEVDPICPVIMFTGMDSAEIARRL
jgi:hypothetical protein